MNTTALQDLRNQGWTIEVISETSLSISAPAGATGSTELNLIVTYPDGSFAGVNTFIDVTMPPIADSHDVTYPPAALPAGGSLTVFPENTDLPDGTLLFLSQDQNLDDARNAGWTIDNYLSGEFFITAPITATEEIQLTFQVVYPDGTFEYTTANISVDPANQADNHDVTYPTTTITAGDTTTITPDTTDLPAGTTITLISNTGIDEGWSITADDNGVLNITAPITATNGIFADFLVAYPDGTTEETTANISVDPANQADNHDVTYPTTTITAGDTTTITPVTSDLPAGTTITLIEDNNLEAAGITGWHFSVTADGKVTASILESSAGRAVINLLVTYPDGTSEVTAVDISALAKPIIEDPISPAPAPRPGGSSFGSS